MIPPLRSPRNRRALRFAVFAAALFGVAAPATAGVMRDAALPTSQGFVNLGEASAGPTNDINDATSFTIGALVSTEDSFGVFAGLPMQLFNPITFSVSSPTSFQFGTAEFGAFSSMSIRELSNDPFVGSRSFSITGMFFQGLYGTRLVPDPSPADLTISFNQTAGTGTAISFNATLSVQAVPEPTSLGLAAAAAGTACLFGVVRRSRRAGRLSFCSGS